MDVLYKQLLQLGFSQVNIKQALALTSDKERAVELILTFQEDRFEIKEKKDEAKQILQIKQGKTNYPKMIILCRTDIKMSIGKIAAQTGHAVLAAYRSTIKAAKHRPGVQAVLQKWQYQGQKKVVLKVNSLQQMRELVNQAKKQQIVAEIIADAGHTQVQPGTITVAALGPWWNDGLDKITGKLRLF